jgi:hypothetical protein
MILFTCSLFVEAGSRVYVTRSAHSTARRSTVSLHRAHVCISSSRIAETGTAVAVTVCAV